ncbi:MAG: hypothetical protein EXS36_08320 [Pedosphaera sp.]|nr:hypothetical protein [Pedosphaera sp.]
MTQIEVEIYRQLCELEAAVAGMSGDGAKPDFVGMFNRLDDLGSRLPSSAAPDLRHYMKQKSYKKARHFLEGKEGENVKNRND